MKKATNITIKHGVRTGSRNWFASKKWTIQCKSWNRYYPDVIVLESEDGDIIVMTPSGGSYEVDMDLGNIPRISDALDVDLYKFVKASIDDLTTDDRDELIITK